MNSELEDAALSPGIRFENLTLGYGSHAAVHHLTCALAPGSLTAVLGPNGSGKSTLLKGIAGLLRPLEGRISITGPAGRPLAYLPQAALIDRGFPMPVEELVGLGLWSQTGAFGACTHRHRHAIAAALTVVGLDGFARRQIGTLSGGQLQRVLFARVLVQDSPLILLDEPFAAIDARTSADLMGVITRWHGEGRTVVAVLHDLELARERFPDALLLAREPVAWGSAREVVTADNLKKANALAEHWDEAAPLCERSPV